MRKEKRFMKGYQTILVPLDGSEVSEQILPEVERLAEAFDAKISVLRVAYVHTVPGVDPTEAQLAVVREAEDYVGKIEKDLQERGFSAEGHVRYGNEAEEILDHCEHSQIDLVAMSTHGRSGVSRWLLGSVAEKVIRHAKHPVLLVRSVE
jgi:nucleotide-binding universal stress UspA family protein